MLILVIIALICLVLGILFMSNTQALDKLSNAMNKVIIKEGSMPAEQAKAVGIFLLVFAAALLFIALRLKR